MSRRKKESLQLSEKTIVNAAIVFLKENDLKKLTIRNLASELDIEGASLYWYIKNKQHLMELIADEICNKIEYPKLNKKAEDQIIDISFQLRNLLLTIKDSAHIMEATPPLMPNRKKLISYIYNLFKDLGMDNNELFSASWMLNNFINSSVIEEYRILENKSSKLHQKVSDELPFDNIEQLDLEREFRFGLEVLLLGFKEKIKEK
ncbi:MULTISPECIES: TetR/AcrR family transcriptional regulator C-terminal domain-containing protein [Staphylococcaceae]|uniref:TetR/AcrR family transcriptional regulator C-terminal domain-containing protein n=1 Tax=Staphylococcaceae TaxID=90964 RepID=UPI0018DE6031|nr:MULTISPECIES: TetR/AcrR family transcriptional regulator C-terminal domain-containing protein [Staphylococcaceae]MEB5686937.1 TetR/AcrR family transcriptional regulator C-terminal domain-containing protein [Mammaliicoccus lentus]QPW18652.1 TetR/AcrR family transcriptional regulator C-terminal domain-containing protein [Staphylococcus saprophyticus]HEI3025198.1 TetR/AcrR family transcriptional regulator C-terminal domain-containing protein [Staphylococcus aureus]